MRSPDNELLEQISILVDVVYQGYFDSLPVISPPSNTSSMCPNLNGKGGGAMV